MTTESPEAVLKYVLMHVHDMPKPSVGASLYSAYDKRQIQDWLGGRLALDFDYSDLFMIEMIARDMDSASIVEVPPSLIVNGDAYIYMDDGLNVLTRETDGLWKLRVSLSMCWGCFGDHRFSGGGCWGVLCQCCGGTGWEGGDLEFCASNELSVDPTNLVITNSPREAFLRLQSQMAILQPLQNVPELDISPAFVRGHTAKIEVTTPETRYLALMQKNADER